MDWLILPAACSSYYEDVAADLTSLRIHKLRRGQLLTDDELMQEEPDADCPDDDGGASEHDGSDDEGAGTGGSPEGREVKWGLLPEGLKVADKPATLDASLLDRLIYMRWDAPYGWLLGTIKVKFDASTPRLFKKFNYRVKWFDGWENHKLDLDNYGSGPQAPYNSWVLLEKVADAVDDAN